MLFAAATKAERSTRNRALVVLAYARGINSSPICSFLQISKGSLFRYWRDFRQGGTEKLFFRKRRSDKKACIPAIQIAVFSLLHSPPSAHGFNRTRRIGSLCNQEEGRTQARRARRTICGSAMAEIQGLFNLDRGPRTLKKSTDPLLLSQEKHR